MRPESPVRLLPVVVLLGLIAPMPVGADHCGAAATVEPSSGRAGDVFVFRTNLGAPSDLYLYRNERLVAQVFLVGDGSVEFAIRTQPGQDGQWRARAEVQGSPDCAAEAAFTVSATPAADVAPASDTPVWAPIVVGAGLVGLVLLLGRRRSGQPS